MIQAQHTVASLAADANSLAPFYQTFAVSERLLLTGHSHQAWPDCSKDGQLAAWQDAAAQVDKKWSLAFVKAERVRRGFAALLGDNGSGEIALGQNTHELLVRFLSALPLRQRPQVLTTDGEFHSLRRQLDRLSEEGVEVVRVSAQPVATLVPRLCQALAAAPDRTAAVMLSTVLFGSAEIVPGLVELQQACSRHGAELLLDAYHHLGVVPFSLTGLEPAFIVGGGYKYCQLGEGNCFLRFPRDCVLRPVITGWFSEFSLIETAPVEGVVPYGVGPDRFAGSTYDPTSHYRAARVFDFFAEQGLSPDFLRAVSLHQVGLLRDAFLALNLDPATIRLASSRPADGIAGFLALHTPSAARIEKALTERGVQVDHRGPILRFGPAPYINDGQLRAAMAHLAETVRSPGVF